MIRGRGLHTGAACAIAFRPCDGPVRFVVDGHPFDGATPDGDRRSTRLTCAARSVSTVEHVCAALAGLGITHGVMVAIEGPEVPLADGGARAFADALASFAPGPPRVAVARAGSVEIGESRYDFAPGRLRVSVEVDFGDPRLAPQASWDGDADDFVRRLAPARTFGFLHEVAMLLERGLAQHVAPESVVVIGDTILSAGEPALPDEPARHKLLDLLGDTWLHGGPLAGALHAVRPGHAATHAAMRLARERGLIVG